MLEYHQIHLERPPFLSTTFKPPKSRLAAKEDWEEAPREPEPNSCASVETVFGSAEDWWKKNGSSIYGVKLSNFLMCFMGFLCVESPIYEVKICEKIGEM